MSNTKPNSIIIIQRSQNCFETVTLISELQFPPVKCVDTDYSPVFYWFGLSIQKSQAWPFQAET